MIYKNNRLIFDNIDISFLGNKYKTPIYCYSLNKITDNINDLKKYFKKIDPLVCYSLKANSNLSILKEIKKHSPIPIVADIHFHFKRAIEAAENGADCLRINPGNIGDKNKIAQVISAAKNNNCSVRI